MRNTIIPFAMILGRNKGLSNRESMTAAVKTQIIASIPGDAGALFGMTSAVNEESLKNKLQASEAARAKAQSELNQANSDWAILKSKGQEQGNDPGKTITINTSDAIVREVLARRGVIISSKAGTDGGLDSVDRLAKSLQFLADVLAANNEPTGGAGGTAGGGGAGGAPEAVATPEERALYQRMSDASTMALAGHTEIKLDEVLSNFNTAFGRMVRVQEEQTQVLSALSQSVEQYTSNQADISNEMIEKFREQMAKHEREEEKYNLTQSESESDAKTETKKPNNKGGSKQEDTTVV